jgi:DNA-binding transcriptional MerR regulator
MTEEPIEKRYYTISEVGDRIGVSTSKLRFWEKEFRELEPRKSRGGHRLYTERDMEMLRMIHYLLKVRKFTLQGAREKLRMNPRDVEYAVRTRETLLGLRELLVTLREGIDEAPTRNA